MLRTVDEKSAEEIHFNNEKRVIRALEYFKQTGKKISEHNEEQKKNESPYNFLYFVLNNDREVLYDRIDRRVDMMFDMGLTDEVIRLIKHGCTKDMTSMKAIGYREFFEYFDGTATLDDVRKKIKLDTRHFAKRQLTWFRREKEVIWVDKDTYDNEQQILEYMMRILQEKNIL